MMKRYFDYSEKERSEMTAETVDSLMARELMEAGVVAPKPPVLEDVPRFEATKTRVYRVKAGYSYLHGFAFRTLEDAEAFTRLSVVDIESGYPSDLTYFKHFDKLGIEPEDVLDQAEFVRVKETAEKAKSIKTANEKATSDYNAECKASRDITEGVWSDWRECREKAARIARIQRTFDEYLNLCDGQGALASRFLAKAYTAEQLQEADEWLGTSFSEPSAREVLEAVESAA